MEKMASNNYFEKRKYYDEVIKPKVDEILTLCRVQKIPVFFAVVTGNTEEKSDYTHETLTPSHLGISLTDDRFPKYVILGSPTLSKKYGLIELNEYHTDDEAHPKRSAVDDFQEMSLYTGRDLDELDDVDYDDISVSVGEFATDALYKESPKDA